MTEVKLPEIKLFGKKIALPENERVEAGENSFGKKSGVGNCNENISGSDSDCYLDPKKVCIVEESDDKDVDKPEAEKISLAEECSKTKSEEEGNDPMVEKPQNPKDLSDCDNSPDTPSLDEDSAGKQSPDSENDQNDTNNSQGKNLKKPDKIIPCPRCKSMETKFCYYNNYNVNQPRHFCKSCQRYWTAGGTMRNVPVGAGRRKNKNSLLPNCRHITISEALQAAQFDAASGFHHPNIKPTGTVLSFGPELPLNDSTADLLKLNKLDSGTLVCGKGTESGNGFSKGSSITLPNQAVHGGKNVYQETIIQHVNSFPTPTPTPVPYFHNLPCPFPTPIPIPMPIPIPAICPPGFPMPFYPAPIWNGAIPGSWSFPWLPPVYPAVNQKPSAPTLAKHSRDGLLLTPDNLHDKELQDPKPLEGSILIPKTLRIADPDEAAMSSIWTTLGIKCDSTNRGGLFKAAFQPKVGEKKQPASTSPLLQANPAAFSRSLNFQEIA